ncbi:MAG: hypothetical protein MUF29_06250, partial [Chitinophagaceae bacterium]|nr:hypothetical protein [Chitinophagaceae bacterium]
MKLPTWSAFIPVLTISALLTIPQNIIGCGPMMEPHDYFTSFFSGSTAEVPNSRTFFYTALLDFYDDWDEYDNQNAFIQESIVDEWQQYAGAQAKRADVVKMIYEVSLANTRLMAQSLKQPATALPTAIKNNTMAMALLKARKVEAIQYLVLAKSIEPFCSVPDAWSTAPKNDSLRMNSFIKQAADAWQKSTDPVLKGKYAFLRCKLAFYNNRLPDCVRWYDEAFTAQSREAVAPLALSYKAGALFRQGKGKEAAYSFSRLFAREDKSRRKQTYLGFLWSTQHCNPQLMEDYIGVTSNNTEKAYMAALFGLYGTESHLPVIQKVHQLDPDCELLPLLLVRQVNKLEEKYLTPKLAAQKGSKTYYYSWIENEATAAADSALKESVAYFEQMANQAGTRGRNLAATSAAYLHYMAGNLPLARKDLELARSLGGNARLQDQQQLIALLVSLSEHPVQDAQAEASLLPGLQWMQQKALQDEEYARYFRNLFAQVIAPAYIQHGDTVKAALAYGVADRAPNGEMRSSNALEFLRNDMQTSQVLRLHQYLTQTPPTAYNQWLAANSAIRLEEVVDMMGTAYFREFDFANALAWLSKSSKQVKLVREHYNYKTNKTTITNINPFHDYINDGQRYDKPASKAYTRLSFAQQMLDLERKLDTMRTAEARAKA